MTVIGVTIASAKDESDISQEVKYTCLHTKGFVRGVTAMDQWFIIVNDAWNSSGLPMNMVVRDYLTTMLDRFTRRVDLIEQLSIFDFAAYVFGHRKIDTVCLQDIADMSLQYVAFFPGRSNYRHEPRSLEYTASIGVTLYQQLSRESEGKDDWFSQAYSEMAQAFGQASLVLKAMTPSFTQSSMIKKESSAIETDYRLITDAESGDIRKRFRQFEGMYLVSDTLSSQSKNN
jgi:hypothetical protein